MKALGITVHEIRAAKGLSQKSVYGGVVSRSFATRFERGDNDIAARKLFAILDNLAVSADEFRFIHHNYRPTNLERALLTTQRYYTEENFPALAAWVRKHRDSPRAYERLVASYNTIRLIAYDHTHVALTPAVRPAYEHLQAAQHWTLQELKLAHLLIPIVAENAGLRALPALTTKMETNCQRYQAPATETLQVQEALLEYYGTLLQVTLNHHAYATAQKLIRKFTAIAPIDLTWDGRFTRQTWLGIWQLYFGDPQLGNTLLDEVLTLEKRYRPRIDNQLFAIIRFRRQDAHQYRQLNQ